MPKKFKGDNSKAAEARSRKEQKKVEEQESKQKALEDEYWKDDDKYGARKQQRKVFGYLLTRSYRDDIQYSKPCILSRDYFEFLFHQLGGQGEKANRTTGKQERER